MNTSSLYKNFLVVLTAGSMLGSCTKSFVDKTPANYLPTSEALSTVSSLQSALNGTYAEIRNVSQFGRDWPIIGDVMADNAFVEARNSGRYTTQYAYAVPITDQVPQDMWAESYTGILRCNQIIDAKVTGADDIKAQAYALRGLLYFKLVTTWGKNVTTDATSLGVPLVLHYDVTAEPGRSTVGDVYTQIVSDLTTAINSAPDYSSSITLSQYAIEGLLARVYLYMGQYQKALTAATDVINNGPFSLLSYDAFGAFWQSPTPNTSAVETLFEVDADAVDNNGFDDLGGIYFLGYQDIYASSQLVGLYSANDARQNWLLPGKTKGGAKTTLVVKYPNTNNNDKDNIKVIRLSEVYLIAAESAARLNQTSDAQDFVNAVATTRDPAFAGYASTGAALVSDIALERRKELAFEGDRLFDMNRLGLDIVRASNAGSAAQGNGMTILASDPKRLAPIPQQEILRNPNIANQQNPGY